MKYKTKKLSVTIGIPAYNEEQNIKNVLESILRQKENGIDIKKIIVVSDGSTDNTVRLAKSINDKRIKVIEFHKRHGKPTILNNLFGIFKSDVLVIIDADSILKDKFVIEILVSKFQKNKSIGLITGNTQPLPARTFLEGAINNYIYARDSIHDEYSIGDTAYTPRGFLAYSQNFLKNFVLPENILNDDAYSYFYCLKNGYEVFHEKDAIVWYRSAQTIREHINQSTRHLAGGIQLHKYFGQKMIEKGFKLPKMALIKIMLYQLMRNPVGYILLKTLNTYCWYKSKKVVNKLNAKWKIISTSKKLIIN